ncbi:hypothetical protein QAD02_011648 [Eretmocerus hayati]|uniref:Uncharacterized protein n=1 Tax=Eretmocerus hayati TaxID=131215 RepID=A0ACC2NXM1_9HYME|nr:hypothetical protein QAD02_011648 [Eretmocerus hayati]
MQAELENALLQQERKSFPSHIKITTYTDWPYSRIKTFENGTTIGEGIAFEVLNMLVRKLNFTYSIIPPAEDMIGNNDTGMIKQLRNKEVDMAVAFIPILSEFRASCDFSEALDEMDTTFLMNRPGTSAKGSGLFAPFNETVWTWIFISVMLVGPTIYTLVLLRSKFTRDHQREKFGFFTCMWFTYGALLKQGTTAAPIGDSVRLLFATWWIFITILTSFYTANLTAFLTSSKFALPIDSLEDLVVKEFYWFTISGRSVSTITKNNYPETNLLKKSRYKLGVEYDDYDMSYETILSIVKEDRRVFIGDRLLTSLSILENYRNKTRENKTSEERCEFVITETNVLPKRRGFAFTRGSLLKKAMDLEIITLVELGLVQHFKLEKLPDAQVCPLNLRTKERRLRTSDLYVTFKVIVWGMVLSIVIFLLEVLTKLLRTILKSNYFQQCCGGELNTKAISCTDTACTKDESNLWIRTPPPMYHLEDDSSSESMTFSFTPRKTYSINGREYYIVTRESGDQRLVPSIMPTRPPSAYLFQYIH